MPMLRFRSRNHQLRHLLLVMRVTHFQLLDLPQQLFSWRRVHGQQSPNASNTHLTISREMTNSDLKMIHHNHRFTNLIHSPFPPSFFMSVSSLYRQFLELKKDLLKGPEALYFSSPYLSFFFLVFSSPSPFLSFLFFP